MISAIFFFSEGLEDSRRFVASSIDIIYFEQLERGITT